MVEFGLIINQNQIGSHFLKFSKQIKEKIEPN